MGEEDDARNSPAMASPEEEADSVMCFADADA
jgi:hypothetical protein